MYSEPFAHQFEEIDKHINNFKQQQPYAQQFVQNVRTPYQKFPRKFPAPRYRKPETRSPFEYQPLLDIYGHQEQEQLDQHMDQRLDQHLDQRLDQHLDQRLDQQMEQHLDQHRDHHLEQQLDPYGLSSKLVDNLSPEFSAQGMWGSGSIWA